MWHTLSPLVSCSHFFLIVCNGVAVYRRYATNASSVTKLWASTLHRVLQDFSGGTRVKKICSDGFVYFISEQKEKNNRFSYWTVLTSQSPQVQINNAAELFIIIPGAYVWCLSRVVFQWLRAKRVLARPAWVSLPRGNWIAQGCNSIEFEECWAAGE